MWRNNLIKIGKWFTNIFLNWHQLNNSAPYPPTQFFSKSAAARAAVVNNFTQWKINKASIKKDHDLKKKKKIAKEVDNDTTKH